MFGKPGGPPRRPLMASIRSLSPLLQNPRHLHSRNPNPTFHFSSPIPRSFWRCARDSGERDATLLPPYSPLTEEKRSLAVATGELFLGLASVLLRKRSSSSGGAIVLPGIDETRYSGSGNKVASVAEEPVIWEQRPEDLVAERERRKVASTGFSFSAAGLLFPYHLGVAQLLLEKGFIKETTPLAGSSAGAIVCVVISSGSSMKDALQATKILAEDCRLNGTAFRLGEVLRNVLNEFLPEDVHTRSNGRVRIAITQLSWRPRGLLVDQFDSKKDLINAVITSSFIPGYLAPRPATLYRNKLCIDGGLTLFLPPTSASKTIRICAFPAKQIGLRDVGISPDCNPEDRAGPRQLFNWALEPADDGVLDKLFELGYLDAEVWAEQNPMDSLVIDDSHTKMIGKLLTS
ncbi:hypothetical protein KSP40_PGU016471 [Platanthera guangdongensis]|uniref:Patatin n=1 Tax=Platanthera guangdongensis TaxID=2320717 RepID=A0ABR2LI73_9ASPA